MAEHTMEQIATELKKLIFFKDITEVGDIVLIAFKKGNVVIYARVKDIVRDRTKRAEWWHVTLQFLTVPSHQAIWTLRTPQFTGMEIFGMGDEELFVKAVDFESSWTADAEPSGTKPPHEDGSISDKVVSLSEVKRRKNWQGK